MSLQKHVHMAGRPKDGDFAGGLFAESPAGAMHPPIARSMSPRHPQSTNSDGGAALSVQWVRIYPYDACVRMTWRRWLACMQPCQLTTLTRNTQDPGGGRGSPKYCQMRKEGKGRPASRVGLPPCKSSTMQSPLSLSYALTGFFFFPFDDDENVNDDAASSWPGIYLPMRDGASDKTQVGLHGNGESNVRSYRNPPVALSGVKIGVGTACKCMHGRAPAAAADDGRARMRSRQRRGAPQVP
jgi:hypothetical protein